jgi:hypothetical protein
LSSNQPKYLPSDRAIQAYVQWKSDFLTSVLNAAVSNLSNQHSTQTSLKCRWNVCSAKILWSMTFLLNETGSPVLLRKVIYEVPGWFISTIYKEVKIQWM